MELLVGVAVGYVLGQYWPLPESAKTKLGEIVSAVKEYFKK